MVILDKFQETKDEKITLEKLEQANIESDLSLSYNIENFKKPTYTNNSNLGKPTTKCHKLLNNYI